MIDRSALEALDRIASRAQDLRDAYRAGAVPRHADVRDAAAVLPASDPLAVVPPPGAWLVTDDARGRRGFTRDGQLRIDDGVLRTAGGDIVLGYPGGVARAAVPVALRLPRADRALGRAADVRIESDGSVAYTRSAIDPRTGTRSPERVTLGTLALARFPAGTEPARLDATRCAAPDGVVPHLGTPGDEGFGGLATASRQTGAIDVEAGVLRLNDAYRAFEALAAARRARDRVDGTALDLVK